jgi:hypothetical protein
VDSAPEIIKGFHKAKALPAASALRLLAP